MAEKLVIRTSHYCNECKPEPVVKIAKKLWKNYSIYLFSILQAIAKASLDLGIPVIVIHKCGASEFITFHFIRGASFVYLNNLALFN